MEFHENLWSGSRAFNLRTDGDRLTDQTDDEASGLWERA
jgi:hypothetical protein